MKQLSTQGLEYIRNLEENDMETILKDSIYVIEQDCMNFKVYMVYHDERLKMFVENVLYDKEWVGKGLTHPMFMEKSSKAWDNYCFGGFSLFFYIHKLKQYLEEAPN
jgi:hypothetical protein